MSQTTTLLLLLCALGCQSPGRGTVGPGDGSDGGGGASDGLDGADGRDTGAPDGVPGAPWRRDEQASPGPITFTELHYHPLGDADLEWIELHNPMVLDMDLSGWALTGGVDLAFPAGTVVAAGGFLVVAANPAELRSQTGFSGALGPWDGALSNGGERLSLVSRSGRTIDSVRYGDDDPWPVEADGSGFTLAKVDHDAASDRAEHWAVTARRGGTPGASNALDPLAPPTERVLIEPEAWWSYDPSGAYPAPDWAAPDYDDSAWEVGQAPFAAGASDRPVPATAWVTADNYVALYAGAADGSGMRLLGEDTDGSWSTVERVDFEVEPGEHAYLAAWELTGDAGSPQMVIAELELSDSVLGTDAVGWEWVLGPPGDNPGGLPDQPPPDAAALAAEVADADADGAWAAPSAEAARTAAPWGGAVGGSFTDAAAFLWGDTFSAASITNTDDTYALFRSLDPIVPPRGNVELTDLPTTVLFRAGFDFDADPANTALWLDCDLDDGAAFTLNGVEVHRENLPAGELSADTLATAVVDDAPLSTALSTEALVRGANVLAVELHQAEPDDLDLLFGCSLTAESWRELPQDTVVFNEVPPARGGPAWVELRNRSAAAQPLGELVLWTSTGDAVALPDTTLAPGGLWVLEDLGLSLEPGDRLFLTAADGETLLDGVRVGDRLRGRADEGGPWRFPAAASPGADNPIERIEDVVINEILYHRAPASRAGEPHAERPEEWLELTNRGDAPIELGGWQLVDAVAYTFPAGTTLAPGGFVVVARDAAALRAAHPGVEVLGDYDGGLGNGGDRVVLLDAAGNPADTVRYFDGGRWPWAADGGGSSLELRDPWADNASAEAWAASDESARSTWTAVTLRGEAGASVVGPDGVWEELVLGLLDQGEVLIDDLSVVQDPDGARVELLEDGDFDAGADAWRLLGTHRHSAVGSDPDDPSNGVLRLTASGPTGHMHNHAETTLLAPVGAGEVEVSFRARWVRGSNQLHSRLYFNRLPTTTLLEQPATSGTPGAENSVRVDNLGPTFEALRQSVAVPEPGEPLGVSIRVDDPDGVGAVTLWSAVDGAAFAATDMTEASDGRFEAELPGQPAGAVVQLYVEATDARGEAATFPAAGPDSRALYAVQGGEGSTTGLHDLRVLMTAEDLDWLHRDVHLMSNDPVGATVVYRESEVFYDVGVRLKGSQRGRPSDLRVGYALRFADDHPFRGSHTSVMLDRSEGTGFGQREVLLNLAMTAAGSVSGEHNDLVQLIAPTSAYTGPAELQLDRFSGLVLDAQFDDGADGTRFEYELIYYPTSTDDGADDGLKRPQPDRVVGAPITDLGADKEDWRWIWLIKNNARRDDYSAILELGRVFSLSLDPFLDEVGGVIDTDQWLRGYAMATLAGVHDQYGGAGSQHNAQFYVRPSDGRVLYFPHDLDYFGGTTMPIVGNADLARLLEDPAHSRVYYGHLLDLIEGSYTTAYLGPWCAQLADLLPRQDFDSHCAYLDARSAHVLEGSSQSVRARFPSLPFEITTNGGEDFTSPVATVTLEGQAWVDVRSITVVGEDAAAELDWVDEATWTLSLPLAPGANAVTLSATDLWGREVGRDTVTVTVESGR